MTDLNEFVKLYSGIYTDFEGVFPNQCMDLMHFYVYICLDITDKSVLAAPNAASAWKLNYPQYFKKINNSATNFPVPGDIVFWGTKVGPDGHVAICTKADSMSLETFDANFPVGTKPHIQSHKYTEGVVGWLHPINAPDSGVEALKKEIERLKGIIKDAQKDLEKA